MWIKTITALFFIGVTFLIFCVNIGWGNHFLYFVSEVPMMDKLGHFLIFGTGAFLLNLALDATSVSILSKKILLGSLIIAVIMTFEESSHAFLSTRTFDLIDLLFNYLGIFVLGKQASYVVRKRKVNQTVSI